MAESVSPIPQSSRQREAPPAVAEMVRLIRDSWRRVEPQLPELAQHFYDTLFSLAPGMRDLFPVSMAADRERPVRSLVHIVQMVDRPDDLNPYLRELGRDFRKFDARSEHYEAVGTALLASLRDRLGPEWTSDVERAWAEAFTIIATSMQDAAANDTGAPWYNATVTGHHRISWELAMVRVEPESNIDYRAGQYLSVEIPQRPRLWRALSPANAPREDGSIEFHVRAVEGGWVSRSIVSHTQIGDTWRLGPPLGRMRVDRERDHNVLMVAGGTGVAPMQAMLDDLAQWGQNPHVHLFYGGRDKEDLYALEELRRINSVNPWLSVVPVVQSDPGEFRCERGTLADAVTRYGGWPGCDVLVAGSPQMTRATVSRMLVSGTTLDQITYDPFCLD